MRTQKKDKKVIYLAGPITDVENYWEPFEIADDDLTSRGYIVLNPARLPQGMTNEQYTRIDMAMIDAADVVYFLENWFRSKGANMEKNYCDYIGKPTAFFLEELFEVLGGMEG